MATDTKCFFAYITIVACVVIIVFAYDLRQTKRAHITWVRVTGIELSYSEWSALRANNALPCRHGGQ